VNEEAWRQRHRREGGTKKAGNLSVTSNFGCMGADIRELLTHPLRKLHAAIGAPDETVEGLARVMSTGTEEVVV